MSIPDFQTIMLPLLSLVSDGREYKFRDVIEALAEQFQPSEEERLELLPSGRSPKFANRVGWATINEDRLGLDVIYIQAKRWENTIGRPDIQQFAGALQGQKARKGVFITTSVFSKAAIDYAHNIESSLVLIDGETLAGLMMDHDVGVTLETLCEIKRIDFDYFEEV